MKQTKNFKLIFVFVAFLFLFTFSLAQGATLTLGSAQGDPGETVNLDLNLSDSNGISGFQIDIQYSINVLENPSASKGSVLNSAGKELYTYTPEVGMLRLVVAGENKNTISDGKVATVSFRIRSDTSPRTTQINLTNLVATNSNAQSVSIDGSDGFVQVGNPSQSADLNGDSLVNSVDLGILLSYWGSTSKPAADLNQDGIVNSVDFGIMLSQWRS